jgi:hypothetical protein
MPDMAEAYKFARSVLCHWLPGITGGIVGAVIAFSATFFQPLPKQIILAAISGYFVFAAFFAWREQYRRASLISRPLELRDQLDQLAKQGENLLNIWLKHPDRRPIAKSGKWTKSVEQFVREHFTVPQFDAFMGQNIALEEMKALEEIRSGVVFHSVDTTTYTFAILITRRLNALKDLRSQIS